MNSPTFSDTITLTSLDNTLSDESLYISNMTSPGPVSFDLSDTITLSSTVGVTGAIGSGYTYANVPNLTIANGAYTSAYGNTAWMNSLSGQIDLKGENADIKINGKSLMAVIEALEQRLNILTPNKELEADWDELRELGERYRALEKQCEEKAKMWAKLKSMPPPEIV